MNQIKFKMLASGYPGFDFPEDLVEEVDLSGFYETEENRFPLYIGTQFGIFPRDFPEETFEGKKIAVLNKSLLSGLQTGIIIYEIRNGKRIEIQKISLEGLAWNWEKLKKYHKEPLSAPKIKIPGFYVNEIWFYFELIGNKYRGFSLPEAYQQAISAAYKDFVVFGHENRGSDWISFLRSERAEDYLNLFRLLDKCIEALYPDLKNLPLPLERVLELFRNIRNPYQKRSKKYPELPAEEDILLLSDFGLCVYYNNFININAYEARTTQNAILEEFRYREFYIKNEYLLKNQANPIRIDKIHGVPVLMINKDVGYREDKELASMEPGASNAQLIYERYYGLYNKLTDVQLVAELNKQIEIRYWGMSRAAVIRAIKAQLKIREIDTSSIADNTSFSLAYCVVLKNKKLIRLGELGQDQLRSILKAYLKKCYPAHNLKKIRIINYDLDKLEMLSLDYSKIYVIPINDLLKKKGEMRVIEAPES
ncbi:hypothetical protein [Salegentibacter maritimus]|uniref:hypothetical protein n=1 Tax=Salegentibacter maritimus TaxID=2794347 RepID=UPI0018E428C3|nr:hypothetical protein [Salegentibacter maritimus]MBI6115982.1 hypothetical protein [Salegentibacter maritimus]